MFKVLLIFSFYLPFQIALNPSSGIDLASIRVIIIFVFLFWLAIGLKNKKIIIKNNPETWFIISFLFLNALSLFFAQNQEWGWRKLAFLFSVFPIYFIFSSIIKNQKEMEKIAKALIWGGLPVALIGIAQFVAQFIFGLEYVYNFWSDYVISPFLGKSFSEAVLQNPSWLVNISGSTYLRATSIFPDPHMLAFYLNILIFICLGLILQNKFTHLIGGRNFVSKNKKAYYVIFLMMVLASLLTFSRGGYLGLFCGFFFLAAYCIIKMKLRHKIMAAGLTLFVGIIILWSGPVSQRFFSSFNLNEGSNKGRIETWGKAVEVIADKPFFGVGLGNYPLEIKAAADYREPIYAHNVYLDIAAETGILNALVWIAILFFSLKNFILKSSENIFFLGAAAAVIAFFIHSLVETPIYSPIVLTLFLIILSFSSFDKNHSNEKMAQL